MSKFAELDVEVARRRYSLGKDSRDWKVEYALEDVQKAKIGTEYVRRIGYRPFDERVIFYTSKSRGLIGQPAAPLAEHIDTGGLALGVTRRVEEGDYRHAFVFEVLPDGHSVSSKETTHVFPLTLKGAFGEATDNWKPEFQTFMKEKYGALPQAETIFGYIYAVLNCTTYRDKFEEFLADDYPRIPFPSNLTDLETLAALGSDLIQRHLLHNLANSVAQYQGNGENKIKEVRYVESEQAIYINVTQYFAPVPPSLWTFQIGTYPALERYLKARLDRVLSLDEIDRVSNIANAIDFTLEQMAAIDEAYGAAFPPNV
jgi:predicted helicase